jgi:hypothetical protein
LNTSTGDITGTKKYKSVSSLTAEYCIKTMLDSGKQQITTSVVSTKQEKSAKEQDDEEEDAGEQAKDESDAESKDIQQKPQLILFSSKQEKQSLNQIILHTLTLLKQIVHFFHASALKQVAECLLRLMTVKHIVR